MFGKEVNLYFSTSGHYCIDIQPNKVSKMDLPVEGQSEHVLIFEGNMNLSDKKKQIQKIHRQFGHASSENIKRLIKNAGVTDQKFFEITDEVIQGCDICLKYKKPAPRPVVGFAWATDFNQTVGMDLKELGPSLWFLHIIDEFTHFSNAAIIRSKTAVIKKFLQCWISLFGTPQKVIMEESLIQMSSEIFVKISISQSKLLQRILLAIMVYVRSITTCWQKLC